MKTTKLGKIIFLKISIILLLFGCSSVKPTERLIKIPCPVDEIKVPKKLDIMNEIPRNKYQKLAPGDQEVKVGTKGGYYFTAPNFGWLMKREQIIKIYIDTILKNISSNNKTIQDHKADVKPNL